MLSTTEFWQILNSNHDVWAWRHSDNLICNVRCHVGAVTIVKPGAAASDLPWLEVGSESLLLIGRAGRSSVYRLILSADITNTECSMQPVTEPFLSFDGYDLVKQHIYISTGLSIGHFIGLIYYKFGYCMIDTEATWCLYAQFELLLSKIVYIMQSCMPIMKNIQHI